MKSIFTIALLLSAIATSYGQIRHIHEDDGARDPRVAAYERRLFPNYSTCYKCRRPWNCCKAHAVNIGNHSGAFALCVDCWTESTVDDRQMYYAMLYREWRKWGPEPRITLKALMDSVIVNSQF